MRSVRLFSGGCSHGGSARRLVQWLAQVLPLSVALVVLGCRDGAEPPTAPASPAAAPAPGAAAAALSFRQISAGEGHTCAVTTSDQAYCWGDANLTPVPVSGGLKFLMVSAGAHRRGGSVTCGLTLDGHAYCWESDLVPFAVPGGRRFRAISTGVDYSCAVTPADVAFCWGVTNTLGQLGTGGGATDTPTRVAGGLRWLRVFTSATHTCGATLDNVGYCWGINVFGQLGSGIPVFTQPKPVKVAGGLQFRQVKPGSGSDEALNGPPELGAGTSCGITIDERAYCWGSGAIGSNADGARTPLRVAGGRRYDFIYPGGLHTCALTVTNVTFCWGNNDAGQLGTGNLDSSVTPVRVATSLHFVILTVAPTGRHSCGLTESGQAYCWGGNNNGQLGDGSRSNRSRPVAVGGGS